MGVDSASLGFLRSLESLLLDANYSSYSGIVALPNGSFAVQYDTGTTHMHRCTTPPQLPNGSFIGCGAQFAVITNVSVFHILEPSHAKQD